MDVFSVEDGEIPPGETRVFNCGFAMEFPEGFAAIVKDRGSMAKQQIQTMAGVYDAGFRGEYNVMLYNIADKSYRVAKGDKIAQLVVLPVEIAEIAEVDELTDSSRGTGKFGSTGKNIHHS